LVDQESIEEDADADADASAVDGEDEDDEVNKDDESASNDFAADFLRLLESRT
jgi:hypothetical protein